MFMKTIGNKKLDFKHVINNYGIWVVALILVVLLSIFAQNFLSFNNIFNLLRQSAIIGIVTLGAACVIITGGIDLSVGAVLGFTATVTASFAVSDKNLPIMVPILAGVLVGAGTGAITGFVVTKGKVPPFVATLGMMSSARGAILVFNQGKPITGFTDGFKAIGQTTFLDIPVLVYIFIILIFVTWFMLNQTKFGRELYAVGDNEEAARVSGVNVNATKFKTYLYNGLLCGLAGVLWAARMQAATSDAGSGYEMDAISGAVIGGVSLNGGVGKISGIVLGIFLLSIITNGLDMLSISVYWQQVIKGIIIVFAVWFDLRSKNA
jgi:ribose/xylose/arabinose/galactoside ABC-type transport system permease subunit